MGTESTQDGQSAACSMRGEHHGEIRWNQHARAHLCVRHMGLRLEQSRREDERKLENLRICLQNLGGRSLATDAQIAAETTRILTLTPSRSAHEIITRRIIGQHNNLKCPLDSAHALSILVKPSTQVLLNCHKRCPTKEILAELGLRWSDLRPAQIPWDPFA
jgi:hypothetical protein